MLTTTRPGNFLALFTIDGAAHRIFLQGKTYL